LFKVLMMEPHLGEIFPGTVVGLTESGLWVELSGWAVDALLPIDALPPDRYRLERGRNRLRGQRRRPIALGDPLTVRLARADRRAQMLELSFEQWGWRETGPPPRKERQG
jgi:ribonuclease R